MVAAVEGFEGDMIVVVIGAVGGVGVGIDRFGARTEEGFCDI